MLSGERIDVGRAPGGGSLSAGDIYSDPSAANKPRDSDQYAQKAFRSIVNASNCANAGGGEMIEGYVTLAKKAGVLSSKIICIDFRARCL